MMAFIHSTLYDRARDQQRREWRALRDQATLRADAAPSRHQDYY